MQPLIIFDLDGTLVDSLPAIFAHCTAAIAEVCLTPPTFSQREVRTWVGEGASHLLAQALAHTRGEPATAEQVAHARTHFLRHYEREPHAHTTPYPGIADMLQTLQPHYALAVLSNKPHHLTQAIVTALFPTIAFRAVAGERPTMPRKPDPASAVNIAQQTLHRGAWFVGDSDIDIQTGQRASMQTVAVTWGMRDRQSLVAAAPTIICDSVAQLQTWFANLH